MDRRAALPLLLLGWVLLYDRGGGDWEPMDDFPYQRTCLSVRDVNVARDVERQIGSALADQPADNPVRRQKASSAERRAGERYRCTWQED